MITGLILFLCAAALAAFCVIRQKKEAYRRLYRDEFAFADRPLAVTPKQRTSPIRTVATRRRRVNRAIVVQSHMAVTSRA